MNISTLSTIAGLVATLGGGGYMVADKLGDKADKTELIVAGVRVDFIYDKMIESYVTQIAILEAKQKKTPEENDRLRYLRDELTRVREIRKQR
jgi:hypothetical protein